MILNTYINLRGLHSTIEHTGTLLLESSTLEFDFFHFVCV